MFMAGNISMGIRTRLDMLFAGVSRPVFTGRSSILFSRFTRSTEALPPTFITA